MRRLLLTTVVFLLLAAPAEAAWVWPLSGEVITRYRNGSDPYAAGQHRGIDIAGPVGAPVVAAAGGEVLFASTAGSAGLTVSVRTGDGFDTSYLHLSALAVRRGERVEAGARLGAVGTSGVRSAVQPHLHFGVREAGSRHAYRDPLAFLPALAPPAPEDPRPAPAPAPAPAPPAPVPAPAPRPVPAPGLAPRSAPAPDRLPAPGHAPSTAPRGAPAPNRGPAPAPGLQTAPAPHRASASVQHRVPARAHSPGAAVSSDGTDAPPAESPRREASSGIAPGSAARRRSDRAPAPGGPDLGWALACAGLLLAAGVLGLSGHTGGASARRGSRLAGALRPLLGRR